MVHNEDTSILLKVFGRISFRIEPFTAYKVSCSFDIDT